MECDGFKEQASVFVDGRLEASKQSALFRHLAECSDCQSFMEAAVQIRQAAAEDQLPVPASVDDALFTALGAQARKRKKLLERIMAAPAWEKRLAIPLPAVAVAFLLIILLAAAVSVMAFRDRNAGFNVVTARGDSIPGGSVVVVYAFPEQEIVGRQTHVDGRRVIERTY